jgi:hypothetical protein
VQEGDQQQQPAGGVLAPKQRLKFTKFSNAYMLVYVRLSDWQRYMAPVAKDGIAPYLLERLEVRLCLFMVLRHLIKGYLSFREHFPDVAYNCAVGVRSCTHSYRTQSTSEHIAEHNIG